MAYKRKFAKRRFGRKARPYAKRSMTAKTVAKIARRVTLKAAEPKHYNFNFGKTEMNHNSFVLMHLNKSDAMPDFGSLDSERVGDQINSSGFKIKMLLGQKADRPNVTFRIYILKVPKGSSYVYNQWFEATTNNVLLDNPNTDFVKVIGRHTWKPHDGAMDNATDEYVYTRSLWVPHKKIVKFGPASGARTHNDDDIYFLIAPFDAYGTLITDNIAYIQMLSTIYYRDP